MRPLFHPRLVVDATYHPENARAIVDLAREADVLFIEAGFLDHDATRAAERSHLTARQAGRCENPRPIHFSPRYAGLGERFRREAEDAFASSS